MADRTGETHIEIQFKENGANVTQWYAVSAQALHQAEAWLSKQSGRSPIALRDWLETNGGTLDRADGPAYVTVWAGGARTDEWCRDGKRHRADGPAYVAVWADGMRVEQWYRDGKLNRAGEPAAVTAWADGSRIEEYFRDGKLDWTDGPAYAAAWTDGTRIEEWYRDGKRHRADGPAYVAVWAEMGGRRVEEFYRNGTLVQEETFLPVSSVSGVKLHPAAPQP